MSPCRARSPGRPRSTPPSRTSSTGPTPAAGPPTASSRSARPCSRAPGAPRAEASDPLELLGPRNPPLGDPGHELPAVHRDTARAAVGLEGRVERLNRELAPLEPRPCALLARRDDRAVDRVGLDAVL